MEPISNVKPKGNRIGNVFIFIVFMIIAQLPLILALTNVGIAVEKNNLSVIIALSLAFVILTIIVIWAIRTYYHKRTYEIVNKRLNKRDIGINILWFIVLRIAVLIFSLFIMKIYGEEQSTNDELLMKNLIDIEHLTLPIVISLIVFFVAITFIAPYLEEHVFRGIFKETVFNKMTLWSPMLISSVIFSMNHASNNIITFLMYMSMGIVLYLAYNRRKNIKDSIMVHMLNNAVASVTMIIMIFT